MESPSNYFSELKEKALPHLRNIAIELAGDRVSKDEGHRLLINPPCHSSNSKQSLHLELEGPKAGQCYCHSCHEGGDILHFVELMRHGTRNDPRNRVDARDWLADRVGMKKLSELVSPERRKALEKERSERDRLYGILNIITQHHHQRLLQNADVLRFLNEKYGFTQETVGGYLFGYADDNQGLLHFLLDERKYTVQDILLSGAFWPRFNSETAQEEPVPLFENRITIPIIQGGNVVYMQARKTPWTPENKFENKKFRNLMLNSEKHPHVSPLLTRDVLFNEDILLDRPAEIILTESATDAVALTAHGFPAMATCTTSMTQTIMERLLPQFKLLSKIYICNDAEGGKSPGMKGALDTAIRLEQAGLEVFIIALPRPDGVEKMDPADFFKTHSGADFERLKVQAHRPMEFTILNISKDTSKVEIYRAAETIAAALAKFPKERQEPYIYLLKEQAGLSLTWIRNTIGTSKVEEKGPTLMEKAQGFRDTHGPLRCNSDYWYRYAGGLYVPLDSHGIETLIDGYLESIAPDTSKGNVTSSQRDEVLKKTALLPDVYLPSHDAMNPERYLLNVKNTMLDGRTMQTFEHSPEHLSTIQLPYEYDRAATCDKWHQFIEDVLPEDATARKFLQMWFGYCLFPDTRHQLFVVLVGEGGNGKSVLLYVLKHLVGVANCSFLSIEDIGQKHKTIHLMHKLLNIATEDESKIIRDTSILKKTTGGNEELMDGEKFKPEVSFIPVCRLIIATNQQLRFSDSSAGFSQRLRVIEFNQTFRGTPREIKGLDELLLEELPGIANWALDGWQMLQADGTFPESESMKAAAEEVRTDTSPVFGFVSECCSTGEPGLFDGRHRLYTTFRDYCEENGQKPMSAKRLWKELRRAAPGLNLPEGQEFVDGRLDRLVTGICLRDTRDGGTDDE